MSYSLIRTGFPMYCAHFPGGDPRRYEPDEEGVTPEELQAWKEACERAEAGETEQDSSAFHAHGEGWAAMGHVVMFGPGVYWCEEDFFGEEERPEGAKDWDREAGS